MLCVRQQLLGFVRACALHTALAGSSVPPAHALQLAKGDIVYGLGVLRV